MENIVIGIVFFLSFIFLLRLVFKQFFGKQAGCAKGCGGACSTVNLPSELNQK
jgi:hypothetical protein